jgi:transcriptional regulator with XRE-family HTH domain
MAKTTAGEQPKAPTEIDLINKVREDKGLSINALADAAKIPQKTLYRRLNGDGLLTFNELREIAAALGVWPSDLLPEELIASKDAA